MAGLITPSPALGCYFDPPHMLLLHICGLAAGSQIKLYLERVITPSTCAGTWQTGVETLPFFVSIQVTF